MAFLGSFNGALSSVKASDLGATVLKHIINETKTIPEDVILGQALTAAQGTRKTNNSLNKLILQLIIHD